MRNPGAVTLPRLQSGAGQDDMLESRTTHVHRIRDRIARDEYSIDAEAVAEAIVARLLAARVSAADPAPEV